jgi:hypothetical protein
VFKDILKNKLSNRFGYDITDANIEEVNTVRPLGPTPEGYFHLHCDNSYAAGTGGNVTYIDGDRITSASITVSESTLDEGELILSEIISGLTNSNDSNLYTSTRNDPLTPGLVNPSPADDIVDDANKSYIAGAYKITPDMIANPAGTLVYSH